MLQSNNIEQIANQIIALGRANGLDLTLHYEACTFWSDDCSRSLFFKVIDGVVCYKMQGVVKHIPSQLLGVSPKSEAMGVFWDSGNVESINIALDLLIAWIIEKREVVDLPNRVSNGIENTL